jgi:hypothetical protein
VKAKKKLGGAYPGQRRPNHQPFIPPESACGKDGQAVVHFKAYGGGNALTLVKQDGSAQPAVGVKPPEYIEVTLPEGVSEGQTIHVQAPDGRLNAIIVPPGFGPGMTFTVEFADAVPPPTADVTAVATNDPASATTTTAVPADDRPDDGFVSGFNNPHYQPPPPAAQATTTFSDDYNAQYYPTSNAQATPVYPK